MQDLFDSIQLKYLLHLDACYFLGVPPFCHGSFSDGKDLEIRLLQAGVHVFVEKPISVLPPEEFKDYVTMVTKVSQERGCLVSVGYMLRYHPAVRRIKEELTKHGRPLNAINVRYASTYTNIAKPFWWDKTQSGGPIVEQATHFCDLIRYFGGEVVLDSITGYSIPPSSSPQNLGYLASLPSIVQEANIPLENDVPRSTQCVWQFTAGGIGTLTHTLLLHDLKYETSIDIWCDGLRISLTNVYFPECTLTIRRSGSNQESVEKFPEADPYLEEDRIFIEAILSGKSDGIESLYEDATKTYELSWAIRRATDKRE